MITQRLQCILDYSHSNTIADIGTDHAYVPISLIEDKKAVKVIAADINKGPLETAKKNIFEHNMTAFIETRLGSGISVLKKGEADQIIIAGMGGILIQEIITADIDIARESELLLQPMNAQYELRKFLIKNEFSIIKEDIAVEGFKVYNFMVVKNGKQKSFDKDIHYHIPPYLKDNKYYTQLYNKKHREFVKVISGLERSNNIDENKLNLYKFWLKELEENK